MQLDLIDILQVLFIYLKLTGQINWSWWLVLSPIIAIIVGYIVYRVIESVKNYID